MVLRVKYINYDIIGIYTYYLIIKKTHVNRYLIFYYVFSDHCFDIYTHNHFFPILLHEEFCTRQIRNKGSPVLSSVYLYIYTVVIGLGRHEHQGLHVFSFFVISKLLNLKKRGHVLLLPGFC